MTAQAPYESLTSADAVQKALADGRRIKIRKPQHTEWFDATPEEIEASAILRARGYGFRAALPERAPVAPREGDAAFWGLYDGQWVNIVNHDNCYRDYTKDEAVAQAVKLTYAALRENNLRRAATPAPPVGADWVAVSKRLPERGQRIEGRNVVGQTWEEEYDPGEPLGLMHEWRPVATPAEARGVGDARWPATDPGYTRVFNAICAATRPEWGGKATAVSVESFMSALAANKPAGEGQ